MQGFDGAAFDRWLTTDPRDADQAAFERWCEQNDVEFDADDDAWERFEQAMVDAEEEYADHLAEAARDRAFDTSSDW